MRPSSPILRQHCGGRTLSLRCCSSSAACASRSCSAAAWRSLTGTPQAVAAGLDESLVRSLSQWPTDARFSGQARVCIGYAEQLLMDAQGVSDEEADRVIDTVGQGGFLVLAYACGLFETTQHARLIVGASRW